MVKAGDGYKFHVTGLTHDERGYPSMNVETQDRLVRRMQDKLKPFANGRALFEAVNLEDAEVVVVSYGITSRVAQRATQLARAQGIRAGIFRIISAWPFPEQHIRELAGRVKAFVFPGIEPGPDGPRSGALRRGPGEGSLRSPRGRQRPQARSHSKSHSGGRPMSEVLLDIPLNATNPVEPFLRMDRMPHIWCPACGIGTTVNCFARALESSKLNLNKVAVVSGIGCTGRVAGYANLDSFHTTHGRAIPFATGLKLSNPELQVVVYSGDGDLFAIGGNHFIHAARRNMDIKVICVNNLTYAMTGGQTGPATPDRGDLGHFALRCV